MVKIKKTRRYLAMLLIFIVVVSAIMQDTILVYAASTPAAKPIPSLTGNQRADAVNIAKSQVGYVEGSGNLNAYGQDLGYNGLEWCAYFAIWCIKKAGVEECPTTGSTTANVTWFQNRGSWHNKQSVAWSYNGHGANGVVDNYVPQPGDFAAIENNGSASDGPEHTAFVVAVDDSWVYTVEGNISQSVVERKYSRSNWKLNGSSSSVYINGFGTINYQTPFFNPQGMIDLLIGGDGTISVRGWAFDKDNVNANLAIHVYIGGPAGSGASAKAITANKERVDVNNAYPGVGNYHGFESTFSVPNRGSVEVYVYAINVGGGDNVLLGSKTVQVTEETPPAKTLPKLTGDQRADAVSIAESQVGYVEGSNDLNIYGKDLGQNGVAWGAYFVLWCLDKAGVEERPTMASTTANITWFQEKGLWHNKQSVPWAYNGHSCNGVVDSNYVPQVGDVIAIESNGVASDGPESTGIVVDIDNSWIYTVEGNVSQAVVARKYSKSSLLLNGTSSTIYINGFGSINYKSPNKPVTGITLNDTSLSLQKGVTYTLTATVSPSDATNKAVTWKSSNTAVATVDSNGKVTAVASGTATITATAKDGSGKSASCSVTVTQSVTGITLNKTSVSLSTGGTYTLTATVSPTDATNKAVTWKSSNTAVATVDTNGKVTAVGAGTATITATAKDGSGKSASCSVTVTQPVTGITLNKTSVSLQKGGTYTLTATVSPSNASNKAVTWKSSNTAVATVDTNGKVTAVGAGSATITATAKDGSGKSASCSVTVTQPVTGITLNKTSVSLQKGGTYTLTATVSPSNASNKAVTWKSSNTAVATVDTNGKVTAVGAGTATITATAKDGSGKSASCSVTVTQPVTGITLNKTSVSLQKGGTYTLTATVSPSNASNKAVTWKSSNTAVATVDTNGKVTAIGTGSATITATAKDGSGKSASCSVTVTQAMSEQEKQVRAFVERMYTIVLGRGAESQGMDDWTKRLLNKEIDGATLVDMFVNSDEFINRNTSDEEYIKILYRAVLGREADASGLKMWKDMLADDWTRDYILEGLVLSTEFKSICDSYGIIAAFDPTAESQVRSFVKRMYTVVLNRRADVVGLNEWTQRLLNGTANGAQLADGFISSDEFVNRNLSNEKYVKVLYRAFFNREPDEGGFNVWMNELAKGAIRRDVMKGFVHSVEFSDLCAQYGIIRGAIQ